MRSVSVRLADLDRVKINLGIAGENEHTHVLFDCKKAFDQYPNATPFLIVTPPRGDIYPAVVTRDGDIVEWVVTDSDLIYHGNGKAQLQFKQGDIIMKSYEARTSIAISSEPTGTVPTPIQNWITQANAILASIPDDINAALAAAKASGEFDGADGVGIAAITLKSTVGLVDTYTITLTDGRDYDFTVTNGKDGDDGDDGVGIQGIAKTGTVGLVDTYTITLTNGQTYTFTVTNGQGSSIVIDDVTPAVDKVFSSSKVNQELTDVKTAISGKADKEDTVLTSTLSCGRKANTTVGTRSIAYGNGTVEASGNMSTALGSGTTASAKDSVAVGENTKATANNTVAGGYYAEASGQVSLAYGYSAKAKGTTSVAFGQHTETNHSSQFVFGERNVPDPSTAAISSRGNYIEIVGNGVNSGYESNARSLDWSGNERLKGDLYVGCNADSTGGTKVAKETVIAPAFDVATANAAGTYVMYTDGVVYYLPDGHTADATWENTNKTATNIGAEITSVKTAIHGVEDILTVGEADAVTNWNQGLINGATGEITQSDTRIYSPDYFEYKAGLKLQMSDGLQYALRYYASNKSFMGADVEWHSESGEIVPRYETFKYFRINISRINGENISPSDSFNVSLGETFHFDKTLSKEGKGADAKAVGDAIKNSTDVRNEATIYYEKGAISTTDGTESVNGARIRSKFIDIDNVDCILIKESNVKYSLRVYSASFTFIGSDRATMNTDPVSKADIKEQFPSAKYIRIVAGLNNDHDVTNVDNVSANISVIGDYPNYKAVLSGNILIQGIDDNETNSPVLCAVKYWHRENKQDVPVGWLFRDIVEPYNFYYSSDGVNMSKVFTWDKTVTDNGNRTPLEYAITITYEGDIICVYRGEVAYTQSITPIRQNPIVYPHNDYENPVQIDFGGNPKPTSWLMNTGCYSESGLFFMCEYTRFGHDYAYVWRVSAPYTSTSDWEIIKTFQVSGEQKGFKHCHMVDRDPFTGVLWLSTGDIPPDAGSSLVGTPGIYYSNDDGDTWSVLLEGSEKYCRQLKFIWCEDYVYWASDASDKTVHYFFRAKRNNSGIIDTTTIEELYHFNDTDAASYNLCYSEDPNGIMILNRYDNETTKDIEIYFWDIQRNKMYVIGVVKSTGNFTTGFRTETMNHYPSPNNIGYLAGFGLCPNNLKMIGNKVNTHVSMYYAYTTDDAYNVGSLNNIVIKIVKR